MNNTIDTVVVAQSTFDLALGFQPEQTKERALLNRKEERVGTRFVFNGETLAEFKERLKLAGFTADEKRLRIQQWLHGDAAKRAHAEAAALASALQTQGYVPNVADVRSTSAVVRWVKPKVSGGAKGGRVAELEAELAALKAQLAARKRK